MTIVSDEQVRPAEEKAARAVDDEHPWPGLDAYTESLSGYFFGRSAEQDELLGCIRRETTTLLFGQSGLGKTSLLQAGLFPRLRERRFLPILVRLDYARGTGPLFDQVKALLAQGFASAGLDEPTKIQSEEKIWQYFHQRDLRLIDRYGLPVTPVVVFDQFEEIFTKGLGREESKLDSRTFLVELADLIENRPPAAVKERLERAPELVERYLFNQENYRIVLTVREDYLPSLEGLRKRAPSLGRNRFRLLRMSGRQALEAVEKPGHQLVAPEVAAEIIRSVGRPGQEDPFGNSGRDAEGDVNDLEVEPSLLSLLCRELNERRLSRNLPTITADLLSGSKDDILDSFYERALDGQPTKIREFVEEELVIDPGVRENMTLERAKIELSQRGIAEEALDELVRRRLLHIEERLEVRRVELIHDVLIGTVVRSRDNRRRRERRKALTRKRWRYAGIGILALAVLGTGITLYVREILATASARSNLAFRNLAMDFARGSDPNKMGIVGVGSLESQRLLSMLSQRIIDFLDKTREETLKRDPNDLALVQIEVNLLPNLAIAIREDDRETAGKIYEDLEKLANKLRDDGRDFASTRGAFFAFLFLAEGLNTLDKTERAIEANQRAIDIWTGRKDYGSDTVGLWMAYAYGQRYGLDLERDKLDDARSSLQKGIAWAEKSSSADNLMESALLHDALGQMLLDQKHAPEAIEEFEKAEEKNIAALTTDHTIESKQTAAERATKLGNVYMDVYSQDRKQAKYLDLAKKKYQDALELRRKLVFSDDAKTKPKEYDNDKATRDVAIALRNVAYLERSFGDKAKAPQLYKESINELTTLVKKSPAPVNQEALGYRYLDLARFLDPTDDRGTRDAYANAVAAFEQASRDSTLTATPHWLIYALRQHALVVARLTIADPTDAKAGLDEARRDLERARPIAYRVLRGSSQSEEATEDVVSVLGNMSWFSLLLGRDAEAFQEAEEALALDASQEWIEVNKAHALLFMGSFDSAKAIYLKMKKKPGPAGGKTTLADDIKTDFGVFRKLGTATPKINSDLKRIEALLRG